MHPASLETLLPEIEHEHKCIHFYEDQNVSPCTHRSKYFLIIIQADSQHFVVQLIGSHSSKDPSKHRSKYLTSREFPYLDRRAIVPVKKVRLGQSLVASDGNDLPDLNNVQGDVYYMFPKAR